MCISPKFPKNLEKILKGNILEISQKSIFLKKKNLSLNHIHLYLNLLMEVDNEEFHRYFLLRNYLLFSEFSRAQNLLMIHSNLYQEVNLVVWDLYTEYSGNVNNQESSKSKKSLFLTFFQIIFWWQKWPYLEVPLSLKTFLSL